MKSSKRGPSLFEVMNKAPVTQTPRRKFSLFGRKQSEPRYVLPVAEALTEEQAEAELAEQREKREAQRLALEEKQRQKEEARAAKKAAKEARRAAKLEARQRTTEGEESPNGSGRLVLSFNTATCMAIAGVVTAVVLSAYAIGHRSVRVGTKLPTVAATGTPESPIPAGGSPLLPTVKQTANKAPTQPVAQPKVQPPAPVEAARDNPDLAHLLQRPQTASAGVGANQPVRVDAAGAGTTDARPENLNYLQIESFLVTRERSGDQLARDVADVREFLLKRGVRTFARKRSNGYVLFAEEGLPPGKESRSQRDALIRKIQSLGAEYRNLGGPYQFKGCFFVSYATTQAGDPVY